MKFSENATKRLNSKRENFQPLPLCLKYDLGKHKSGGRGGGKTEFSNKTKTKDILFSVT